MRLRHLEIFDAIMQTGSLTGAARLLKLSQPTISTALRQMERDLGFLLFHRLKGGMKPTPEAQQVAERTQDIMRRVGGVMRLSQDLRHGTGGVVTIGTTPSVLETLLPPAVEAMLAACPGVRIILRSLTSPEVAQRVAVGDVDFGIVHTPVSAAALVAETLFASEFACILPRGHALEAQATVSLADLLPYRLIAPRPGSPGGALLAKGFDGLGLAKQVEIQIGFGPAANAMVRQGVGIAVTDGYGAAAALAAPDLAVRPLTPRIAMRTMLLTSDEHPLSIHAARMIGLVREAAIPHLPKPLRGRDT